MSFFQNFSFERTTSKKCSFAARRAKNCKSFCKTCSGFARSSDFRNFRHDGTNRHERIGKFREFVRVFVKFKKVLDNNMIYDIISDKLNDMLTKEEKA
jgi:hypothetical protein